MAEDKKGFYTGLTEDEAKEFHEVYMSGFVLFTIVAVVAHFLTYIWRPWFRPLPEGYASLDGVRDIAVSALSVLV
ncbi:MAG: light-harvesting antenna LH1, beta subunit [Pseudomonadota bacterium]